jgi:hypothetical protein
MLWAMPGYFILGAIASCWHKYYPICGFGVGVGEWLECGTKIFALNVVGNAGLLYALI